MNLEIGLSHKFCDWFHFERSRNELDACRLAAAWFRHLIDGEDMAGTIPDDFRRQVYNAEDGRAVVRFRLGQTFLSVWMAFVNAPALRRNIVWHLCLELIEGEAWEKAPNWWPAVLEEARTPFGVPLSRSPLFPRLPMFIASLGAPPTW